MRLRRQIWLLRQLRRQIFGSSGSVGNHFAPTANLDSRQLSRQKFGSVGKYLATSANNWLRRPIRLLRQLCRQIFGSSSSVGNHVALTANLASRQLSRQIFGSVGKYLDLSANNWLRRQIIGSVGQFGFCGSSVGKYLDPAALSAIMSLRRQIGLLEAAQLANIWVRRQIFGSVGKYLAIWLHRQLRRQIIDSAGKLGFYGSSVGKWRTHARTTITNNNKPDDNW
jgi:hypothetical protein